MEKLSLFKTIHPELEEYIKYECDNFWLDYLQRFVKDEMELDLGSQTEEQDLSRIESFAQIHQMESFEGGKRRLREEIDNKVLEVKAAQFYLHTGWGNCDDDASDYHDAKEDLGDDKRELERLQRLYSELYGTEDETEEKDLSG